MRVTTPAAPTNSLQYVRTCGSTSSLAVLCPSCGGSLGRQRDLCATPRGELRAVPTFAMIERYSTAVWFSIVPGILSKSGVHSSG